MVVGVQDEASLGKIDIFTVEQGAGRGGGGGSRKRHPPGGWLARSSCWGPPPFRQCAVG
jgi:hypothetical protein